MDALLADGSEKPKTAQESKDSCTIFVRNLPFEWTDTNLHTTFEDIGPIKRAFIVISKHHARKYDQKERDSGGSRGFGFVQFAVENDAIRAVSEMNGKEIQGRKIKVERAVKKGTKKDEVVKMKKQEKQQEKQQEKSKKVIITPTPTPTPATTDGQDSETSDDEDETPVRPQKQQQQQLQKRVKHDDDDDVESDDDDEMDRDSSDEEEEKQPTKPTPTSPTPTSTSTSTPASTSKPTSTTSSRTLLLSGLPMHTTEAEIRAVASQHGTIKQLIYPSPESTTKHHACRIEYDTSSSASHAHTSLSKHQFHSTKIRCIYLDDTKSARLIIRNLPFNITETYLRKQLNKTCSDVVVTEIKIPTDANGKVRGFGFLSCNDLDDAVRIMTRLNGTSIMSRPIAVDWALAKNDYESRATVSAKKAAMERVKIEEEKKKQEQAVTETKENAQEEKSEDEKSDDQQSDDDEKDDKQDEDEDEDDEDDAMEDDNDSEEDGPDDDDIDVDAQHSEESSDDDSKDGSESKKPTFNDVQNGSTIFIRNLAYDTTNDELYEKFRTFGGVKVVKIVMDKEMNRPKGTAFVQFYKPESAQKVLNTVNSNTNLSLSQRTNKTRVTSALNPNAIQLGGRALIISLAVDRNEATRLTTVAEKQRDKRNLYLAKEGAIAPDSDAAEGLSKSDLAKRAKAAKEKREKLKNPNYMISQTRLSIRNLPPEYDEKQLKKLFLDTVKKQVDVNVAKQTVKRGISTTINPHIRQVKIVRDKERIEGTTGLGRSKKYGFIEFEQHEHALMALRALNNNPMVWGKDRRPIIEFALEDHRKLLLRKKQQAAIQHRLLNREKLDVKTTTPNDKKRKATESDNQSQKKQKTNDKTVTKPTTATKPTTSNKPSQPAKTSDKPAKPTKPAKQSPTASKPVTQPTSKPAAASKKESKPSTSTSPATATATATATAPASASASAPKTKSALKRERAASSTDRLSKRAKKEWEAEKSFDSMVDAYKKKLFQAPVEQIKNATSRWYE